MRNLRAAGIGISMFILGAVIAWFAAGRPRPVTPAPELIARAIKAYEGRAVIENWLTSSLRTEGTLKTYTGTAATMHVVEFREGEKLLQQVEGIGLKMTTFCDDQSGWRAADDLSYDLSPGEWNRFRITGRSLRFLLMAGEEGYPISNLGWKDLPDGLRAEAVQISQPSGPAISIYFDPETHRVAAVAFTIPSADGARKTDVMYRHLDYRPVDGIWIPFHDETYRNGNHYATLIVSQIVPGVSVPQSAFQQPITPTIAAPFTTSLGMVNGVPFVYANVNGKGPYKFFIWINSGVTALSLAVARTLNVAAGSEVNTRAYNEPVHAHAARLSSLNVGAAKVENLAVWIDDVRQGSPQYGSDFGGFLGFNFLAHFQVTMDFPAAKVTFAPRSSPLPSGSSAGLTIDNGLTWVDAVAYGRPIRMMIVTTASHTMLLPHCIPEPVRHDARRVTDTLGADGRRLKEYELEKPDLKIGGAAVQDAPVYFLDPDAETRGELRNTNDDGPDNSLGTSSLQHFRVTLDFDKLRMALQAH